MQELVRACQTLSTQVAEVVTRLNIADDIRELNELTVAIERPDFWQDQKRAQETMKHQARLQAKIEPWLHLKAELQETLELAELQDASLEQELSDRLKKLEERFSRLKEQLKFTGPYDPYDAILNIYAGAGGTDAQDWAEMLLRMYVRWAEKGGYKATILEQSAGDEAGIKSAVVEIEGNNMYGLLKGEHGVHRLVRLSPFNADNLRQTSFAKIDVLPKIERSEDLAIDEKELKVDVFRSGGHGGQSVNTTDSAVRVTHVPTGIVVAIQNERSQLQNKETAMTILRSKLAQMQLEQHQEKLSELKGPNQSAEWGNQIRSYVLHPYKMVKDLRTNYETSDPEAVLDGNLNGFIEAYLDMTPTIN